MNKRNIVKIILIITILLLSSLPITEVLATSNQDIKETTDHQQDNNLLYDNNGNTLNDNTNNYTYDINNRLIEVENSKTNETTTFTYGPLGNRVTTTYDNTTTHHIYDGTDIIQDRDNDGTILLREFVSDLAMINHIDAENPIPYYYLQDILGCTVALADDQGIIVEEYAYEPYGETFITDSEGNQLLDSTCVNPYLWTGQRYDSNNDLYLFSQRVYSLELGRFIQQDPMGYTDGLDLYEYTSSNPINNIDPLGLEGEKWDIIYSHDEELLLNGEEEKLEAVKKARFFSLYFTYTDTPLDITETVSGRDLLTGEKLPGWLVGVTAFAIILPLASGKMLRTGAKAGVRYLSDVFTLRKMKVGKSDQLLDIVNPNVVTRNMPFGEKLHIIPHMHRADLGDGHVRKIVFGVAEDAEGTKYASAFYKSTGSSEKFGRYRRGKWFPFMGVANGQFIKGFEVIQNGKWIGTEFPIDYMKKVSQRDFLGALADSSMKTASKEEIIRYLTLSGMYDTIVRYAGNPTVQHAGVSIKASERCGFFTDMGKLTSPGEINQVIADTMKQYFGI